MSNTISVKTPTDEFLLTGRLCELSGYFYLPPLKRVPPQRTFYNNTTVIREKQPLSLCNTSNELNIKAHRDDRRFSKLEGLRIGEEEISKVVPCRSSSIYGHRATKIGPFEEAERSHVKISVVKNEFYRNNDINILHKY